jgi:hypothetical protein
LLSAISSSEVTVQLYRGDDPHVMHASKTNNLGFRINIKKDCIELRDPSDTWSCLINAQELESFLHKYRTNRSGTHSSQERQSNCLVWLNIMMKKPKRKSKSQCRTEAVEKFSVSARAFDRLWKKAIGDAHPSWPQPGPLKS